MYGYGWNGNQQPMDDRMWVNSQEEAEGFLIAPNNIVHLWHRTEPIIYEKRKDANGNEFPMVIIKYSAQKVKTKDELYEERFQRMEQMLMRLAGGAENVEQ